MPTAEQQKKKLPPWESSLILLYNILVVNFFPHKEVCARNYVC